MGAQAQKYVAGDRVRITYNGQNGNRVTEPGTVWNHEDGFTVVSTDYGQLAVATPFGDELIERSSSKQPTPTLTPKYAVGDVIKTRIENIFEQKVDVVARIALIRDYGKYVMYGFRTLSPMPGTFGATKEEDVIGLAAEAQEGRDLRVGDRVVAEYTDDLEHKRHKVRGEIRFIDEAGYAIVNDFDGNEKPVVSVVAFSEARSDIDVPPARHPALVEDEAGVDASIRELISEFNEEPPFLQALAEMMKQTGIINVEEGDEVYAADELSAQVSHLSAEVNALKIADEQRSQYREECQSRGVDYESRLTAIEAALDDEGIDIPSTGSDLDNGDLNVGIGQPLDATITLRQVGTKYHVAYDGNRGASKAELLAVAKVIIERAADLD